MLKNYKTSIQAVLILGAIALNWFKVIDIEQLAAAIGAFSALGLFGAEDSK